MLHLTGKSAKSGQVRKKRFDKKKPLFGKRDISIVWRLLARSGAVAIVFTSAIYSIYSGGHITDPNNVLYNIQGKIAAKFGYAAQDIRIAGLKRQSAVAVLNAIHVKPNDSLIGFRPQEAKSVLEKADWVKRAEVRRIYPNQLEIDVVERTPFALWQREGEFYVIDRDGAAFTTIEPGEVAGLFVVTGDEAQKKVFQLVNHIEAHKGLKSKIAAAGRIGKRRWNLYLKNGMKVLLPERDEVAGLARFVDLNKRLGLSAKAVAAVDLRFKDRVIITPMKGIEAKVKVSQR